MATVAGLIKALGEGGLKLACVQATAASGIATLATGLKTILTGGAVVSVADSAEAITTESGATTGSDVAKIHDISGGTVTAAVFNLQAAANAIGSGTACNVNCIAVGY